MGGLGAWFALSVLIIVTPGPDTALVVANTLRGGRRAAAATAIGIALGIFAWSTASAFGVAVVLQRSAPAFTALRLAGAGYLGYLGIRALLGRGEFAARPQPGPTARDLTAFRQGLLSNLTNPKTGLFFVTVLPQFLGPGDPPARLALMIGGFELILLVWLNLYGLAISRLGATPAFARLRGWLGRLSGALLVGLGVRVALESR